MIPVIVGMTVGALIMGLAAGLEARSKAKRLSRRRAWEVAEHNRLSRLEWEARQKRINSCV